MGSQEMDMTERAHTHTGLYLMFYQVLSIKLSYRTNLKLVGHVHMSLFDFFYPCHHGGSDSKESAVMQETWV